MKKLLKVLFRLFLLCIGWGIGSLLVDYTPLWFVVIVVLAGIAYLVYVED